MSGISSVGSSMSAASYNPLDKNHDGVVDAQELQEAAQSGLLSASVLADEDSDDSSDQSATGAFSGNLASMLLQMQQSSGSGETSTDSSATDTSSVEKTSNSSSGGTATSDNTSQNALEVFIKEMEASMNVYQNTYGQYDPDPSDSVAA